MNQVDSVRACPQVRCESPPMVHFLPEEDREPDANPATEKGFPEGVDESGHAQAAPVEEGMSRKREAVVQRSGRDAHNEPCHPGLLRHRHEPFAPVGNNTDHEKGDIPGHIGKGSLNESKKRDPSIDGVPETDDKSNHGEEDRKRDYLSRPRKPAFPLRGSAREDMAPCPVADGEDEQVLNEPEMAEVEVRPGRAIPPGGTKPVAEVEVTVVREERTQSVWP